MDKERTNNFFNKPLGKKFYVVSLIVVIYVISTLTPMFYMGTKNFYNIAFVVIFVGLSITITSLCLFSIAEVQVKTISKSKRKEALFEASQIANSEHAGFVNFFFDRNLKILYASTGFYKIIGYNRDELKKYFNNHLISLVVDEDIERIRNLKSGLCPGDSIQVEIRLRTKFQNIIWILLNGNYIIDKNGNYMLSTIILDITKSKQMQEKLLHEEERYRVAAEISNDILFEYDLEADLMMFGDKFKEIFDNSPIIRKFMATQSSWDSLIHVEDREIFKEYMYNLRSGQEMIESEFRIMDHSKKYIWCQIKGKTIYDYEKKPLRVIGKMVNIDIQKRELINLENKAKRDPLTGVFNKNTTKEIIDQYIMDHTMGKHMFMIVDIDNFKYVNDNFGHLQGDKILSFVINQVKKYFSKGEVIGRIGGDEFAVFIGDVDNGDAIISKAESLQQVLCASFQENGQELSISGSIGIALYPNDGTCYNELLNCADKALYEVKGRGKNGFQIFA